MASKLIELRQRMRGYQPVRTAEEGDGELDSSSASDSDASSGPQRDMHPPRRLRREGAGVRRAGGASVASMELNFDDFPDTEEAPSTWRRLAKTLGFHRETLQSSPSDRGIGTNSRSSNESNACLYVVLALSISGVIFLSIIAYMLDSDYEYIKIPGGRKKMVLSGGVYGAIYMYVLTAMSCLYFILSRAPGEYNNGRGS